MSSVLRPAPSRPLTNVEREELLALDVPVNLATLDIDGYLRITSIWFIWSNGAFYMTSVPGAWRLTNLERDHRAAVCIDIESLSNQDGVRPSRLINARGLVELSEGADGEWTRRITLKYVPGAVGQQRADFRASMPRIAIRLIPETLIAIGTVDEIDATRL